MHEACGLDLEMETAERAVAQCDSDGSVLDRIARAAPKLGLRAARADVALRQLPRVVGPGQPILVAAPTTSEIVAVVSADGRKLRVVTASDPTGQDVTVPALAERLGLAGPDVATPCLALESTTMGALSVPGAQPGDVQTALRRLWGLLASEREDLQAIVIYAVAAGLFTLTIPIAVQTLVNTVAFGALFQPLVVTTVLVIAGLALYGSLTALEVYVVELLQRRIVVRVVGDLAYRVPRARTSALDRIYGPEQLNRFFDVFTIHKATAQLLIDGLDLALKGVIGLLLLAFYHPFFLAFDVVLIMALAVVLFWLGRGGMRTAIIESKKKYRLAGWLEELGRKPAAFKPLAASKLAYDRADSLTRDFLVARIAHFRVVLRQTVGSLAIYALASGLLLGLGGWLVMQGQLTLGQLVAAELVLTTVVTSFAKMGKHLESFYDLVAAVDKVGALFDLPIEEDGGDGTPEAPNGAGSSLEMQSVDVELAGHTVFRNLDLTLSPGDRVAVLGASGSGKSLVAEVLFGLRPVRRGSVRVDGAHIEDIPLGVLRNRVSVARIDDVVHGSLMDNVRLGDASVTAVDARRALEEAELGAVLQRLPEGMDTEILPGGRPLTESESARLVLARAMAAKPSLLVVDGLLDIQDETTRLELGRRLCSPERPWTLMVLTRVESLARSLPRSVSLAEGRTMDLLATETR
ncbi:MAG: ABC transporter ATP-binding protein [Myxococcota bacterium]